MEGVTNNKRNYKWIKMYTASDFYESTRTCWEDFKTNDQLNQLASKIKPRVLKRPHATERSGVIWPYHNRSTELVTSLTHKLRLEKIQLSFRRITIKHVSRFQTPPNSRPRLTSLIMFILRVYKCHKL